MSWTGSLNDAAAAGATVLLLWLTAACHSGSDAEPTDTTSGPSTSFGQLDAGKLRDAGSATHTARLDATATAPKPGWTSAESSCEPGTYSGDFMCQVSGVLPWGGQITFSLVAMRVDGADVSFLEIKAGTRLDGMDTMNGTFGGNLAGMFDCDTGELTGSLADGFYNGNFGFSIKLAGDLSGQYGAGDGGTPGFTGIMGPLSNPDWGPVSPTAMCTWSAVRVGDAQPDDAGTP